MNKRTAGLVVWLWLAVGAFGDTGWMQSGVRAWYFGGVDGGGSSASDAEEAHLLGAVSGTQVTVTRHAGTGQWTTTQPAQQSTHNFSTQGPFWMHPTALATVAAGSYWQGLEITSVARASRTYETLPCNKLLPALAMFTQTANRNIVIINYMLPNSSVGTAYFDATTGLLLQRHDLWGGTKMFLVLAEINYDFATSTAFPEPNRPHPGFKSTVALSSFNAGAVMIQAGVETAQKDDVEMWVQTTETANGGYPTLSSTINACFFGGVPELRIIDSAQASQTRPTAWNVAGQYLWWWVPSAALGRTQIQILDATMPRTATGANTEFTANVAPSALYFHWARFDATGYATALWAADPRISLSVGPNNAFNPVVSVDGLNYYRTQMGTATPASAWDAGYTSIGGGWRRLGWFGDYAPMGGWIFHNKQGFWYPAASSTPQNIWFYTQDMGWIYTSSTLYPFMYRSSPAAWLWYNGATNPRWFNNLTTGQWESRP